jgi:coproporphyrinogen III oxidase-like Fe-S oxidoreductase
MNTEQAQRYFSALRKEIHLYHAAGYEFGDVYVGGGTPTVLPEELAETLALVQRLFGVSQVSVETNPNHLRQPVLDILRDAGVNRLSVGVQSFNDSLLKEMERFQPYGSSEKILEGLQLAQGQFDTFNVDMIFNFPHQTMDSLGQDIEYLKNLQVDQISYYPLMPATTTERAMSRHIGRVEFKHERQMYYTILDSLLPDYQPGSAWCFSRHPATIDEYIIDHDEYLGIGSGSLSYLDGNIYSSSFSITRYLDMVESGRSALTACRPLSVHEQAQYDFLVKLFGLRMNKAAMQQKYGPDFARLIRKELLLFKMLGALQEDAVEYRLSRNGMYYWVLMMREFFIGVNNFRAQMRARISEERQALVKLN